MKKNYNDYAVDELVAQYKQDKNERVFAEIMEKTKGLIYVFARSYSRSIIGAEMEDLISEGNLILWDAVQTFDDTRDCRFTTYLCGCLKRNYNTLFSMCNCKKRNPGCFVQSYEQINSNSEYEEDGNRLGNSEFVERFPELSLFYRLFSPLNSEMICIFPYFCPYAESAREIRGIFVALHINNWFSEPILI